MIPTNIINSKICEKNDIFTENKGQGAICIKDNKIQDDIDLNKYFGKWVNIEENVLCESFRQKNPNYIIIDNFLCDEYAQYVYDEFPLDFGNPDWHKYENPVEVKYANNNISSFKDNLQYLFYILSTKKFIEKMRMITGIHNLEYDEYLHGAGIHMYPRDGRLNLHLDYEKHPISNKQRRINIILYLTKDWNDEWNGHTEIWNESLTKPIVRSPVRFNHAIIFQTNEISWHGVPDKICCPPNIFRISFAYYYVSPLEAEASKDKFGANEHGYRIKASFMKKPSDPYCEKMAKIYKIRMNRRIEKEDMQNI